MKRTLLVVGLIMAVFICLNSANAAETHHFDVKMSNVNEDFITINHAVKARLSNGTWIDAWWVACLRDATENATGRASETEGIYTFTGSFDRANTNVSFINSTLVLPTRNITKQFLLPATGIWKGTANSTSGNLDFAFQEVGSSFNIGDATDQVDTGMWSLDRDLAVPLSATINLSDGTFNLGTYGIVLDMPYVRAADGGLLKSYMHGVYGKFALTPSAVGGTVVLIDKLTLLAPYLGLSFTIGATAVSTAIYVRRMKQRKAEHK